MTLNLFDTLQALLAQDPRFVAEDGTLLRNAVYEAAMGMDAGLLRLLLSDPDTRARFFTEADGILVFDKVGFGWAVSNRAFLPDSYTRFQNKIGLADSSGQLLSASGGVTLVFPYKDCVLEGGQTREDQRRGEIFYNETLAPHEIDRLLAPKVLVHPLRCAPEGEAPAAEIRPEDNLLIRGNNLLVLASLRRRYAGRVRMAYWDVPYNTGSDSFGYNDRFSRSTWLVFLKNRVEQLLPLLAEDGVLLIQCSFHQQAYLQVLLDEIIGNHVMTFNVLARHPDRTLTADKPFNDVVEYVLVYAKSPSFQMPRMVREKSVDDYRWTVEELAPGEEVSFDGRKGWIFRPDQYRLTKAAPSREHFKIMTVRGSIREKVSSGRFYVKYLQPLEASYPPKTLFKVEGIGDDMYSYRYFYLPPEGNKNGAYLQGMPTSSTETYKPYPNFLDFVQSYNTVNREGNGEFRNGKKPEDLIAYLMGIFTAPGDLVLDAFSGSGTTAAVALKLGRQFLCIEQMDYAETLTKRRIEGVLRGEENDILPESGWQGGGSFLYCELARLNQRYAEEIASAATAEALADLYRRIVDTGFISSRITRRDMEETAGDFAALSLPDQKWFLLELLDKNMLYVNLCDLEDAEFAVSPEDRAFNRSFYREA